MDPTPRGPSAKSSNSFTALAVVLSLVLGPTACSNDEGGSDSGPAATLTTQPDRTTTTASTEEVEADVEAAFMAATKAFYEMLEDPDPDDPRLDIHRAGKNRDEVRQLLEYMQERGEIVEYDRAGIPTTEVESVTLAKSQPGRAAIEVCTVDQATWLIETSRQVTDDSIFSRRERFDLQHDDAAGWQVVDGETIERFKGELKCD